MVLEASLRPSQWALQMLIRAIKNINRKLEEKQERPVYHFNEVKKKVKKILPQIN